MSIQRVGVIGAGPIGMMHATLARLQGAQKVIVLDNEPAEYAKLFWRKTGKGWYHKVALKHVARGVYTVEMPEIPDEGIEYYLRVKTAGGKELVWPSTAPALNQTVVQN